MEAITDDVSRQGEAAIVALNRFGDGKVTGGPTATLLDEKATAVGSAESRLDQLDAPEAATASARDLASSIGDLMRQLQTAAIDVRAADRGLRDPALVAHEQASLLLAHESSISALSRAVRSLAAE